MTVLDASGLLFEWFKANDTFYMKEDFIKLVLVSGEPERDQATVQLALQKLRETQILEESILKGDGEADATYWVLVKPFSTYEQTVSVSPVLAASIAKLINDYCEYLEDNTELVDPTSLQEKDLQNLLYICSKFLENNA